MCSQGAVRDHCCRTPGQALNQARIDTMHCCEDRQGLEAFQPGNVDGRMLGDGHKIIGSELAGCWPSVRLAKDPYCHIPP